ncbi:hypothetical protein CYMTET_18190 [Cymbomonas tetramitiformis]|uniref:Uncharacterized protein n=1 Tax=Cymbomonas tetramitiformis TaxID=36881 RepID=A0AAE0L6J1_9CHLO|nr:hypothetical protein CYMTET_18190 [Cymbomonas tetramitiformis]
MTSSLESPFDPILIEVMSAETPSLSVDEVQSMYEYQVPIVAEGGACSRKKEMAAEPYCLADSLGLGKDYEALATHPQTARIWCLGKIMKLLAEEISAEWVGVYRSVDLGSGPVLLKEAYVGRPSRAEFPLTKEFAENSNNSTVGLTGAVLGIIDAEAFRPEHFTTEFRARIDKVCAGIASSGLLRPVD